MHLQTNALGLNLLEDVFSRAIQDMPPEKAPGTYCKFVQLDDWATSLSDTIPDQFGCTWTEVSCVSKADTTRRKKVNEMGCLRVENFKN